jgi:hypothetical protein
MIGCYDGEIYTVEPLLGYAWGGVKNPDGSIKWGHVKIPEILVPGQKIIYRYTGSDQTLTVPDGVTKLKVKCWGAWGTFNDSGGVGSTSGGGYTYGEIAVTAGDKFRIMVGGYTHALSGVRNVLHPGAYGFGGGYGYNGTSWFIAGGGGLSGIFTGDTTILATDTARARIIAGGGGGGTAAGPPHVSRPSEGGNGTGGQPTFQGATSPLSNPYGGSGGGGYNGGNYVANGGVTGSGGTGFLHGSVTNGEIVKATVANQHAKNNDPDYEFGWAGLVVVELYAPAE